MGKFNHDDRSGGGDFKGRGFDRGDRGDRGGFGARPSMHKATCSDCGKPCEVPFRPTGEKPVFCNDCFRAKRAGGFKKSGEKPTYRPSAEPARGDQFSALNAKLDQILKILSATSNKAEPAKEVEKAEAKKAPAKPKKEAKKAPAKTKAKKK